AIHVETRRETKLNIFAAVFNQVTQARNVATLIHNSKKIEKRKRKWRRGVVGKVNMSRNCKEAFGGNAHNLKRGRIYSARVRIDDLAISADENVSSRLIDQNGSRLCINRSKQHQKNGSQNE